MVCDHSAPLKRDGTRTRLPRGRNPIALDLEPPGTIPVSLCSLRVDSREAIRDTDRDARRIAGIEHHVRIAAGVQVPEGTIQARAGNFQQLREGTDLEVAKAPHLYVGLAGPDLQTRQPTDLKVEAHGHQQVGPTKLQSEVRTGVDEVGILRRFGHHDQGDVIAAHGRHYSTDIGNGRDN